MGEQHGINIKSHTRLEPTRAGGVQGRKVIKGRKLRVPNGGSCKQTISGGALTEAKELNKERNTFQLPRLLCSTIMSEGKGSLPSVLKRGI